MVPYRQLDPTGTRWRAGLTHGGCGEGHPTPCKAPQLSCPRRAAAHASTRTVHSKSTPVSTRDRQAGAFMSGENSPRALSDSRRPQWRDPRLAPPPSGGRAGAPSVTLFALQGGVSDTSLWGGDRQADRCASRFSLPRVRWPGAWQKLCVLRRVRRERVCWCEAEAKQALPWVKSIHSGPGGQCRAVPADIPQGSGKAGDGQ